MEKLAMRIGKSKRHLSIRFGLAMCLIILVSQLSAGTLLTHSATMVSIVPSSISALVGQSFNVNVTISGVSDLYGWEYRINWDANLLNVTSVAEGPFLKTGGNTFFSYNLNLTGGSMVVDSTLLGNALGVNGSGTLSTLTFYVGNAGQTPLNLYNVTLVDSNNRDIFCVTASGYAYFNLPQDLEVTKVDVSPTILFPGNVVNINVTVHNRGTSAQSFNTTVYANAQVVGFSFDSWLDSGKSTTIPFVWNTTGFVKGGYAISASVSVVPGEINVANNNGEADTPVTLLSNGHDVAISRVGMEKTVVGQGCKMSITTIAKDYGVFSEIFIVTVYADTTALYTQSVSLNSGMAATINFTWNTTSFAYGNYTLKADASTVLGETDVTNNEYACQTFVHVGVPGDVSGAVLGQYDGAVNMRDITYFVLKFNTRLGSVGWSPNADINDDGTVNMRDIASAILSFNKHE